MSIFVDLTKVFDTVDHGILLDKLDRYGIRGHANDFVRSYLSDRRQYTVINGVNPTLKNITCGVPQGSVLGPLFFAIYINDIYKAVGQNDVRLFADDTTLFMHHSDLNTLTVDIISKFNELNRWCISNKLTIHASKTNFILFHTINQESGTRNLLFSANNIGISTWIFGNIWRVTVYLGSSLYNPSYSN